MDIIAEVDYYKAVALAHSLIGVILFFVISPLVLANRKGTTFHRFTGLTFAALCVAFFATNQIIPIFRYFTMPNFMVSILVIVTLLNFCGILMFVLAMLPHFPSIKQSYSRSAIILLMPLSIALIAVAWSNEFKQHYIWLGVVGILLSARDVYALATQKKPHLHGLAQHGHYMLGLYVFFNVFMILTIPPSAYDIRWWLTAVSFTPLFYLIAQPCAGHFTTLRRIPSLLALLLLLTFMAGLYAEYIHFKDRWCFGRDKVYSAICMGTYNGVRDMFQEHF